MLEDITTNQLGGGVICIYDDEGLVGGILRLKWQCFIRMGGHSKKGAFKRKYLWRIQNS